MGGAPRFSQDQFLAVKLAAADLLQAHNLCSAIPPHERTPFENDIAQMGRKRLERISGSEQGEPKA